MEKAAECHSEPFVERRRIHTLNSRIICKSWILRLLSQAQNDTGGVRAQIHAPPKKSKNQNLIIILHAYIKPTPGVVVVVKVAVIVPIRYIIRACIHAKTLAYVITRRQVKREVVFAPAIAR